MTKNPEEQLSMCAKCGSKCCRHVALAIDTPTCKSDYDNIRWYLMHKDVTVSIDNDGEWILQFDAKCENLGSDQSCVSYDDRPKICRDYPDKDSFCEFETDELPHKLLFTTVSEFEKYLEREGVDWRFKKLSQ